jgi:hypothetical protein
MRWVRPLLQVAGALFLTLSAATAGFIGWDLYSNTSAKVNRATRNDTLFILNWAGISARQDFKIIGSYQSPRSPTGDHLDYYCIDLPKFEIADAERNEWQDGPEMNPLLSDALELALSGAPRYGSCLPSFEQANSETMKQMFVSVTLQDREASAGDIILYDTKDHKLYYVSFKT